MNFENKTVFITGVSKGIGRAIAIEFAKRKATVLGCSRNTSCINDLEKELDIIGTQYQFFQANASIYADMQTVFDKCIENYGKIDVLINNAGVLKDSTILKMSEKQWDEVITNNTKSVFICTKIVGQIMKQQHSGHIVNISSIAAVTPNIGQSNYASSKAAIEAFTRCSALEFAKYGINVNCVAPGCIQTSIYENVSSEIIDSFIKGIPLNKFGNVEDIAYSVVFLSSPYSRYITGEVLRVDGGFSISLL